MANPGPEKSHPSVQIDPEASVRLVKKMLRARYILSVVHAFLFLAMWASYAVSNQGLAEGVPGVFFGNYILHSLRLRHAAA
jgi:hypothetical protein